MRNPAYLSFPAVLLVGAAALLAGEATAVAREASTTAPQPAAAAAPAPEAPASVEEWHAVNGERFKRQWGIDIVGVRPVSSGYMLRFAYRVLDPVKAAPLFDERVKPYLYDVATGTRMAVPAMENIGELRQTPKPVANRTYFVIFGNPGKFVKHGARVRIVIGPFSVDDLVVD